jgi:multiple sugar transport system substrate-binding protein
MYDMTAKVAMVLHLNKTLIIITPLVFLLALSGCESRQGPKVVFAVGGAPAELAFWEEVVRDFVTHTGAQVELLRRPADTEQQRQGLIIALKAGMTDPDVFLMDVAWLGLFAASNWLVPLQQVDRSAFFAQVLNLVDIHNGQLLALPVYLDAGLLYYRKDLLERFAIAQPPETWQELAEQAIRVQEEMRKSDADFYGFIWQGRQYEGLIPNFQEFAGARGGFIVHNENNPRIILDQPQNRAALRFMHDLIWKYKISPPFTYTEMQEEETRLLFQTGGALFARNWPYAWALHQSQESPVRGKIGVTLPPAPSGGERTSSLGGWHIGVSTFSDAKPLALAFVQYVCSYPVQKRMILRLGWNPGRRDLYTDPEVLQQAPHLQVLQQALQVATPRPLLPYYPQLSVIAQRRINGVLARRIDATSALHEAEREIAALLARYGW